MKNRFDHIVRSVTITCLMAGIIAHLLVPFSTEAQKTAFTRWLNHNVVTSGNESEIKLRNSINELPDQTGDFLGLVHQASELVANHKEHFNISDSNSEKTRHLPESSWLIEQWNSFQNQKSGFNTVLIESVKTLSSWIPQSTHFYLITRDTESYQNKLFKNTFFYSFRLFTDPFQPLSSEISINAP